MKNIIAFILLLMIGSTSLLQSATVDLRFTQQTISDTHYTVTVQMKSQDIDFRLGSATIFFSYNLDAIKEPVAMPLNFGTGTLCPVAQEEQYAHDFSTLEPTNKKVGEGNYAILLKTANTGCPSVATEWVDVAQFQFKLVNSQLAPQLSFNAKYTAFNTNEDNGNQHENGTFGDLDDFLSVGINDPAAANEFTAIIYPTIAQDFLHIQYHIPNATQNQKIGITIYDRAGKEWMNKQVDGLSGTQNQKLSVEHLPKGYYLIKINEGKQMKSYKFVKL